MAGLRFIELQSRPLEFLDFTSVTLDEFQQLVPPFEAAFHAHMAAWRMDGRLLLDSRVVDVLMAYNPTFVILSSLKSLSFNSLKNES